MTVDQAVAAYRADVVEVYRPPETPPEERVVWSDLSPAERMAYQAQRAGARDWSYLAECRAEREGDRADVGPAWKPSDEGRQWETGSPG